MQHTSTRDGLTYQYVLLFLVLFSYGNMGGAECAAIPVPVY